MSRSILPRRATMPTAPEFAGLLPTRKRVLDPADRVSEVLFGMIMVLTFTGSLSVAGAGRSEVGTMLLGALGCNLAWGIIDGVLYLMGCLAERSRGLLTLRAVRGAEDPHDAHQMLAEALPQTVASVLEPADLEMLRQRLTRLPEPPESAGLRKDDWLGMVAVFLLVFVSVFPVAIPFLFLRDVSVALRISNGIAIAVLFAMGYAFGRIIGRRPWVMGISMVFLGGALVGITMALGG